MITYYSLIKGNITYLYKVENGTIYYLTRKGFDFVEDIKDLLKHTDLVWHTSAFELSALRKDTGFYPPIEDAEILIVKARILGL